MTPALRALFIGTVTYIGYICYDDGCHLVKFARHSSRKEITQTAKKLASLEIVVDKMHMFRHKDKWCKEFDDLNDVSSTWTV